MYEANFEILERDSITVNFEVNATPSKLSQLENDTNFITEESIGDGTITITQDGVSFGSFTVNQKNDTTINLTGGGTVTDVQIDGTSIVEDKKANIPIADGNHLGVVKTNTSYGIEVVSGNIATISASENIIDAKLNGRQIISAKNLDYAVKSGITTNAITLTDTEKQNACSWLGAITQDDIPVKDVQAYGTSILSDGVANIPLANTNNLAGLVRTSSDQGITMNGPYLKIVQATTTQLEAKTSDRLPITPNNLDYAVKVGVTTNTNALTGEEKTNACNWLGAGHQRTTVIDSTTPTIVLDKALSNTDYQYGTITSLTITEIENSYLETNIFFTAGTEITVDLPDTLKIIGNLSFEAEKQYVMSICNNTLIVGVIS